MRQNSRWSLGQRRAEEIGARLWPSYTAKSIGLFCLLFGVIAALGALVQIDPVWAYGPYDPVAILPGAQPDWPLGWIEGAIRLFPGVNLRIGPYLVPEVFFPAVLFPVLIFAGLSLHPFVEQCFSFDFEVHHVLRLPYQQPFNTALASAVAVMMLVLLFAAGHDVIALATGNSIAMIRAILRVLFFAAPAVAFGAVYWRCARKRHRRAAADTPAARLISPATGSKSRP